MVNGSKPLIGQFDAPIGIQDTTQKLRNKML